MSLFLKIQHPFFSIRLVSFCYELREREVNHLRHVTSSYRSSHCTVIIVVSTIGVTEYLSKRTRRKKKINSNNEEEGVEILDVDEEEK